MNLSDHPGGTQERTCNSNGTWGPFSTCQGEGVCFGEGVCAPGEVQSQPCGLCGQETRLCNATCQWDNWSGCGGQGACQPGASGECGACGRQTCSPACQRGPCTGEGECQPGQQSTTGCPTCRGKTCTNNCTWSGQCNQCVGCNTFTQCGMGCPSGYHATNYGCSSSCGDSCWSNNQTTCQAD